MSDIYRFEATGKWNKARLRAFWTTLRGSLTGNKDSTHLWNFNEVSQSLRLRNAVYRGVQGIPLNRIVGSVGRYQDFTQAFLPIRDSMGDRWKKIAQLSLDPSSGLPPIDVYKVGDWYFVKDGNHRVSVARQIEVAYIDAHVWEYLEAMPAAGTDMDMHALLLDAERQNFMEQTGLDKARPNHTIKLSEPGGYTELLYQIHHYQEVLNLIDEDEPVCTDAATAWYDMIYEASVQLIQDSGVMELFPDRTPADFFVWIMRYHQQLEERYGRRVFLQDAARNFKQRQLRARLRRFWPRRPRRT
ncbi:MAG: hypothetical protein IT324_12670 [Anaerolineae bacterium]|nr:hypothetical protein [Anaerolineae bacterium]